MTTKIVIHIQIDKVETLKQLHAEAKLVKGFLLGHYTEKEYLEKFQGFEQLLKAVNMAFKHFTGNE